MADLLPAIAAGEVQPARWAKAHIESCLRCQAEIARYRRLLRTLRELRDDPQRPAPGTLAAILGAVESAGDLRRLAFLRHGRRAAFLSGVAVATAAGTGLAIWAARRREAPVTS